MTHPLTPREKVVFKQPCENCQRMTTVDLNAVASCSGDHAELARLAEAATPGSWSAADWGDDFGENRFTVQATEPEKLSPGQSSIWPDGIRCLRVAETMEGERPAEDTAFIAAANPATVLTLLAENAALRESISRHDRHVSGMLRARLSAEARATEAERKLAEAVGRSDDLLKALEWYGEQARLARLIHSEGDAGRHALADDGGSRARAFIANHETIRINAWLSKEAERG